MAEVTRKTKASTAAIKGPGRAQLTQEALELGELTPKK